MIGVDRASGTDEAYVNDLNGNRRMSGTTNWVAGANNQLTGDGTYTYQYDDEGNRTKRTKTSDSTYVDYVFDHRNRLTQANSKNSGGTVTQQVDYVYDADDRLVKRTLDADGAGAGAPVDEYFVYDGKEVVLRWSGGSLKNRYLNGPMVDQILADEQLHSGGELLWPLADNLGTVRDLVNNSDVIRNHLNYDAFGNVTETDTTYDHIGGFQGLFRDEASGLYLSQTRWYDPRTGKWMQEDWIGFDGGDTNLGRFVGKSVTNATDPTGEWKRDTWKRVGPQRYEGYGIAECDNEDLAELARLVTGSKSDYDGKWTGTVKQGDRIPIRSLLRKVDQRMRENVVRATSSFSGQFPLYRQRYENGTGKLDEEAINQFFPPAGIIGKQVVDCLGAARIVEVKGLIDTLQPGEFDKLYTLASVPFEPSANPKQILIGDWGYIRNGVRYLQLHPGSGMQGENVIYVGNGGYWGWFQGVHTFDEWVETLLNAYNSQIDASLQIKSIPGWVTEQHKFLAVAEISMDAFDLRRRESIGLGTPPVGFNRWGGPAF